MAAAASSSAAAAAAASAGKEALTRLSMPIKDAALEAAKRAKPQWHLVDAKDQVCISECVVDLGLGGCGVVEGCVWVIEQLGWIAIRVGGLID